MPLQRMTRSEKQQHTRLRILEAANSEIADKGFGAITIEEITRLSGLTRGAFYSNFSSKNEMLLCLLDHKLKERSEHALATHESGKDIHGAKPSHPELMLLRDDAQSAMVWIEAMLHAWRDRDFRHRLMPLFASDQAKNDALQEGLKSYAPSDANELDTDVITSIRALTDDALQFVITAPANLGGKEGNTKISMMFTLS